MRWISVVVLLVISAGYPGSGQAELLVCDTLKMSRVSQDGVLAAAAFLRSHYETWAADVPTEGVDPRSNALWPEGFGGKKCTVFANNQITVRGAACAQVMSLLVDAGQWPTWYANGSDVDVKSGATKLEAGTEFGFRTFGSNQSCRVLEVTNSLVSWSCHNSFRLGHIHHRWNCTETSDGALVSTQECQNGLAIYLVDLIKPAGSTMRETMQRGHQVWLEGLRCKVANNDWHLTPMGR